MRWPHWLMTCAFVAGGCASAVSPDRTFGLTNATASRVVLINGGVSTLSSKVTDAFISSIEYPVYEYVLEDATHLDLVAAGVENLKPQVIVALGIRAARFAREAFPTVPLVYALVVQDESHPITGANVAGIGLNLSTTTEFMMYKLVISKLKNVVAFYTPGKSDALANKAREELKDIGLDLSLQSTALLATPEAAAKVMASADAIWWFNDPGMMSQQGFAQILKIANTVNRPLLSSSFRELALAGSLMAFTLDLENIGGQAASMVSELLQTGTVTQDLAVRQPIGGHLVFNDSIGRRLGIGLPAAAQPFVSEILGKAD